MSESLESDNIGSINFPGKRDCMVELRSYVGEADTFSRTLLCENLLSVYSLLLLMAMI